MRRAIAVIVCLAALGTAAASLAAPTRGRYEGLTAQAQFLRFDVTADRRHVVQFAVGYVGMFCPNDNQTSGTIPKTSRSRRFKVDSKGRFGFKLKNYSVTGRVGAKRATGTLRMTEDGAAGPCDSGTVKWTARLKR
jgi:hypothetical protein